MRGLLVAEHPGPCPPGFDDDLRQLAAAARDQVDERCREIELGLDRAAEAAAAHAAELMRHTLLHER